MLLLVSMSLLAHKSSGCSWVAAFGGRQDSAEYAAAADNLDFAIHQAFYNASTGAYVDLLQTHLVMPLASGVVPTTLEAAVVTSLEDAIAATGGHVDTGLTGTYVF